MGVHARGAAPSGARPQELIFVSSKAVFKPPKAIRGGVPVCFPQFGGFGPLAQHGFARNSAFEVAGGGADTVTLALRPSPEQLKLFPRAFLLTVTARRPAAPGRAGRTLRRPCVAAAALGAPSARQRGAAGPWGAAAPVGSARAAWYCGRPSGPDSPSCAGGRRSRWAQTGWSSG